MVPRGGDRTRAIGAEAKRRDVVLVSRQDGEKTAGGRVPEPRRVLRIIASRKQPRPVRAEKDFRDCRLVAAQHGDFLARRAVPHVNGAAESVDGRRRNPLTIRTESHV